MPSFTLRVRPVGTPMVSCCCGCGCFCGTKPLMLSMERGLVLACSIPDLRYDDHQRLQRRWSIGDNKERSLVEGSVEATTITIAS